MWGIIPDGAVRYSGFSRSAGQRWETHQHVGLQLFDAQDPRIPTRGICTRKNHHYSAIPMEVPITQTVAMRSFEECACRTLGGALGIEVQSPKYLDQIRNSEPRMWQSAHTSDSSSHDHVELQYHFLYVACGKGVSPLVKQHANSASDGCSTIMQTLNNCPCTVLLLCSKFSSDHVQ